MMANRCPTHTNTRGIKSQLGTHRLETGALAPAASYPAHPHPCHSSASQARPSLQAGPFIRLARSSSSSSPNDNNHLPALNPHPSNPESPESMCGCATGAPLGLAGQRKPRPQQPPFLIHSTPQLRHRLRWAGPYGPPFSAHLAKPCLAGSTSPPPSSQPSSLRRYPASSSWP